MIKYYVTTRLIHSKATLGDVPIEEYSLKQETFVLFSSAIRVVACMTHYLIEKNYFVPTHNAIVL